LVIISAVPPFDKKVDPLNSIIPLPVLIRVRGEVICVADTVVDVVPISVAMLS
jgi:hypothetical protein